MSQEIRLKVEGVGECDYVIRGQTRIIWESRAFDSVNNTLYLDITYVPDRIPTDSEETHTGYQGKNSRCSSVLSELNPQGRRLRTVRCQANMSRTHRLVVKMDLQKGDDNLYRISRQTDFYQPEVGQSRTARRGLTFP